MKTIELTTISPSLAELLALANNETVVLKTPEGRAYVLGAVDDLDDFDEELALMRKHEELMALLDERSQEQTTYTLQEVREQLGLT